MAGKDLRQLYMRRFVGMTKYKKREGAGIVALYLAQITASVLAGHLLLAQPFTIGTGFLMALVIVFIGTRLRGLNNIVHECSHSTYCESRQDNVALGRLCVSLLLGCFEEYKRDHLSHHAHLGDYDHDREMAPIENFGLHDPITPRTILRHIMTPLLGRHLKTYSGINLSASDGIIYLGLKLVLLAGMGLLLATIPMTALLFVWFPLFYVLPTFNFWTDCLDHAGIVSHEDELDATRNVLAPAPIKWLFFPRNDCYHLVHHLFPQVPARHLEKAHEALSKHAAYRSKAAAMQPTHRKLTKLAAKAT